MIIKKIKTAVKLIKGKRYGMLLDRMPMANFIMSSTNLIPHPQNYKYILLGGHGLGMTALIHYLNKIEAKPMEIWKFEIATPFYFYKKFDGLVLDKAPRNMQSNLIFRTCSKKVPIYQLVRDPISVIKSNINVTMFHHISDIRNKDDARLKLINVINYIPHLMFYFGSMRSLVNHLKLDITYLKMQDIDEDGMQRTIDNFKNRFGYKKNNSNEDNESVIKGSIFPRCFPHIFTIDNAKFILSTRSRLNGLSIKEMDMSTNIEDIRESINGQYHIIDDNIMVDNYKQYPLILASIDQYTPPHLNRLAMEQALKYIDFCMQSIQRHKNLMFNEDEIIDFLVDKNNHLEVNFGKNLACKIHNELRYIRNEREDIMKEFIYTNKLLDYFK